MKKNWTAPVTLFVLVLVTLILYIVCGNKDEEPIDDRQTGLVWDFNERVFTDKEGVVHEPEIIEDYGGADYYMYVDDMWVDPDGYKVTEDKVEHLREHREWNEHAMEVYEKTLDVVNDTATYERPAEIDGVVITFDGKTLNFVRDTKQSVVNNFFGCEQYTSTVEIGDCTVSILNNGDTDCVDSLAFSGSSENMTVSGIALGKCISSDFFDIWGAPTSSYINYNSHTWCYEWDCFEGMWLTVVCDDTLDTVLSVSIFYPHWGV